MFQGWDSYFLLIGGAGGALIGLLFVVATLTVDIDHAQALRGAVLYLTPTVFHFGAVVTVSAMALASRLPALATAGLIATTGLIGFGYALSVAIRLARGRAPQPAHWSDFWFYGAAVAALYLMLTLGAGLVRAAPVAAPFLVASATLGLLLVAIRNAWDLVTWLAPRRPAENGG